MKVDRLVSIILILLDKERISAQELADMFEVSPRTIYRDIESINIAGIPISSTSGVGGGFQIMPQYKLDKKVFSSSDLSTILLGLSILSNPSNMIQDAELANVLAKIKSFIPDDCAKEIELKSSQICIDLSPWMGNKNIQPYLEKLKVALQGNNLISFYYSDHHGNKTHRTIEPYQPVLKNSHWYIYGYCSIRNDFRVFKLSRMFNLEIKEETFTPREYAKPQLDFSNVAHNKQIEIKIRIHRSIMDRVLDYCTYEHFTPDGDEHYIVRFPFFENDYNYHILFSFGDQCECLEPLHIRQEMKRKIQNIANLYKNTY